MARLSGRADFIRIPKSFCLFHSLLSFNKCFVVALRWWFGIGRLKLPADCEKCEMDSWETIYGSYECAAVTHICVRAALSCSKANIAPPPSGGDFSPLLGPERATLSNRYGGKIFFYPRNTVGRRAIHR